VPANDLLLDVLKRFARTIAGRFDVSDVLYELGDRIIEILDADAAGVCLGGTDGLLRFITASNDAGVRMEATQQETQQGPCYEAYRTTMPVLIEDLSAHDDWALFRARGAEVGFCAVAGIPMTLDGEPFGSVNIYQRTTRQWADDDVAAALVLADIATSYVVHSTRLDEAHRVNQQLERALESRIYIEQAKGLLAGERAISIDESFQVLRRHARNKNATLRSVAEAVVKLGLRP
jgi:GAF domain-containing protein